MKAKKDTCTKCKKCCRFDDKDLYFAPILTDEEMETIIGLGYSPNLFSKFKDYNKIFQLKLIKNGKKYDCPFLDLQSHLCKIYPNRPFDCRIWPFIIMRDKKNKVVIGCFNKEYCDIVYSKKEFDIFSNKLLKWIEKEKIVELISKYPGLIWDYEEDTSIIMRL